MDNDTISRQAAIDKADSLYRDTKNDECYMITGYNHAISDIRAILKSLPSAQPELCEDAVSRQRLLSDLKELVAAWKKYPVMAEQIKGVEAAIGYVELIPSVKPNSKELSETHKALDIISRQAAIDAIHGAIFDFFDICDDDEQLLEINKAISGRIKQLPSAQPKIGRWIHDGSKWTNRWICSECGYKWFFDCIEGAYCPNCGADMRGEQNG